MAARKPTVSGPTACVAVLAAAGKPMSAGAIAEVVVESGVVPTLKGKTPKATLSAQITARAKQGRTFKKVGSGRPQRFQLRADVEPPAGELVDVLRDRAREAARAEQRRTREKAAAPA